MVQHEEAVRRSVGRSVGQWRINGSIHNELYSASVCVISTWRDSNATGAGSERVDWGGELCNEINCVASVEIMSVFDRMLSMQIALAHISNWEVIIMMSPRDL